MGCQSSSSSSSICPRTGSRSITSTGVLGSGNFHHEFKLGKKLGEGAFGQVRLATSSDGDQCAVKVLDFQRGIAPQEARDEVKSWMRACGHENVVQLRSAFFDKSLGYIVMELCTCSVMDMLADNSAAGEEDLSRFFRGMLLGLARVHEVGVIHRDVKPDNFLLGGADGQTVKLADFGMAVCLKQGAVMRGVAGTAPYMSPEMVDGERYGLGTDVWSMGVVAYLMLFGEFPYGPRAQSSDQMKRAVLRGEPPSFSPAEADWGAPSSEAVSFARLLMVRHPPNRPSADTALQLPFVTPVDEEDDEPAPLPAYVSSRLSAQPIARLARQATAQLKVRGDPTVQRDLDELLQRLQGGKAEASGDRSTFCRSFSAAGLGGGARTSGDDDDESTPFVRPQIQRSSTYDGSRDLTSAELAAAQEALLEADNDDDSSCSADSDSVISTGSGSTNYLDCRSNATCSQPGTLDMLPAMPTMPPQPIDEDEPMDFPLTCPLRPLPANPATCPLQPRPVKILW